MCLVACVGKSRLSWQQRKALLSQMLNFIGQDQSRATGYLALTAPYRATSQTRLISDRAFRPSDLEVLPCRSWRKVPRCHSAIAISQPVSDGLAEREWLPVLHSQDRRLAVVTLQTTGFANSNAPTLRLLNRLEEMSDTQTVLRELVAQGVNSFIAIVVSVESQATYLSCFGTPMSLFRFSHDSCWFVSPSREIFNEAAARVLGSQSTKLEIALPVADGSILTMLSDGTIFAVADLLAERKS